MSADLRTQSDGGMAAASDADVCGNPPNVDRTARRVDVTEETPRTKGHENGDQYVVEFAGKFD